MGIGIKNGSWWDVVAKTRSDEAERIHKGLRPRLTPPVVSGRENIKTSEAAEAFIAAHRSKHDGEGHYSSSTERGKRRREKLHPQG